jgi:hypothetical protein
MPMCQIIFVSSFIIPTLSLPYPFVHVLSVDDSQDEDFLSRSLSLK